MKFTISGDAIVLADSEVGALAKAKLGNWEEYDLSAGETSDWEVTGKATLNE